MSEIENHLFEERFGADDKSVDAREGELKYQKISDWCILANEEDGAMLHHARVGIENCVWHERYVDDIIIPYFLTSKRRKQGRRRLPSTRTVIDVGASYGWMAVSFAKYFDEVKCFEIRRDIRHALRQNTSRFSNIEVFDHGLSSIEDNVKVCARLNSGASRVSIRRDQDINAPGRYTEETINRKKEGHGCVVRTLDSYNFNNVDCIKLDVEEHEYYVLIGAMETIKKWKPVLIVEISYAGKRHLSLFKPRQRIFKLLHSLGYEIVDVRGKDFIFKHTSLNHWDDLTL